MRSWIWMVLLAGALGVTAFGGYYAWQRPAMEYTTANEVEWLRHEFNLNEAQFAEIEAIHAAYQPVCDYLCARVIEAQQSLEAKMLAAASYTPEIEEELGRFSRVKEECHRAMLKHVYEVAAVMGPEERRRYLEKAKPQVTMHDSVRR